MIRKVFGFYIWSEKDLVKFLNKDICTTKCRTGKCLKAKPKLPDLDNKGE